MRYCPSCGYKLSSSEPEVPQNAVQEVTGSILEGYVGTETNESGVKMAVPGVLDNRERLMQLRNRPTPIIKPVRMDGEMDKFGDLVVGEGLVQDG